VRKKTSEVWTKHTDNEFVCIVSKCKSYREIFTHFDSIKSKGTNNKTLKKRITDLNIDTSHFRRERESNQLMSLGEVMVEGSTYNRGHLKSRLIKMGILKNKCSICGLEGMWQNKPIMMVLDHVNGTHNDHRLENLRMVCPNCNSQLETFSGRNNIKKEKEKNYCVRCGCEMKRKTEKQQCRGCTARNQKRKVERPTKEQLTEDVAVMTMMAVGRKYGVSDTSIRSWCKTYDIKWRV
jgi:Zn finger protein HypA/HybF involved in hydrogenase expression